MSVLLMCPELLGTELGVITRYFLTFIHCLQPPFAFGMNLAAKELV